MLSSMTMYFLNLDILKLYYLRLDLFMARITSYLMKMRQ